MQKQYEAPGDEMVRGIALALAGQAGPLLPILHAVQDRLGFIDERSIRIIADVLNLSRAEVHGVVSFYSDFRKSMPGRAEIKLCRAEACQAMGCEDLAPAIEVRLQTRCGETSADGRFSLETVYCLGNCALAPAALINGTLIGRLTADRLSDALKELLI